MSEGRKRRGRPRQFDPAVALADAGSAFLRHGYAGTSLETLTAEMRLNKPSLYAAFGDKHALYLRVLDARYRMVAKRYEAAFERGRTLEESLRNVLEDAVEVSLGEGGPPGCPIAAAETTESLTDEDVREFTRRFRAQTDKGLGRWIARRLSADAPISSETLARLMNCVLHDLALRARVGESRGKLREIARDAARVFAMAAGERE